jgi:ATP-dependent DNA helicase RecG
MAPTEILANQHYATISKLLEPLGVNVDLRTGNFKGKASSVKGKENIDILIGTHAVLSEKINFDKLGLVVIDEQHRFGVEQRSIIRSKGKNPHVLTMTATPIPRTVALTLYGDLELSVLDEMPKGRQIVKTWLVPDTKREAGYVWIQEQIKKGDQAFIVCPFIEESESLTTIKAASTEFERLQKHVFPKLRLGLLHGKMRAKEKDGVLDLFRAGKIDILVATPVVEVGIDIPNATIILIEAAERFGLSQLHQLRGRVGRGDKQSYCLLFTESSNLQTTNRLKSLEHIHNGAELAELDLKMRGAGELYGTMQHGRKWLKIASFGDTRLLEISKQEAIKVFPTLTNYPLLLAKVEEASTKQVSPD